MKTEQTEFLKLTTRPARLNMVETAWLLGFNAHDIPVLTAAGLLKPLGKPPANGPKYFATADIQTVAADTRWLGKASDQIVNFWKQKNRGRAQENLTVEIDPSRN